MPTQYSAPRWLQSGIGACLVYAAISVALTLFNVRRPAPGRRCCPLRRAPLPAPLCRCAVLHSAAARRLAVLASRPLAVRR